MKWLLKQYIKLKIWCSKKRGWINSLEDEIKYLKSRDINNSSWLELQKTGLKYKSDKETSGLFDVQYDSIVAYWKGADCNSISRVIQVIEHIKGNKSLLVTYLAYPFKKSHTTIILLEKKFKHSKIKYCCFDYGKLTYCSYFIEDCINEIARKYKSKVIAYVLQDINFNIVEY